MSADIVDWTVTLRTPDGREYAQLDAKVHVSIGGYREPYLKSIDAIYVDAWFLLKSSVPHKHIKSAVDLLDTDAGPVANMIGKQSAEEFMKDPRFADRAVPEPDIEGDRADYEYEQRWR